MLMKIMMISMINGIPNGCPLQCWYWEDRYCNVDENDDDLDDHNDHDNQWDPQWLSTVVLVSGGQVMINIMTMIAMKSTQCKHVQHCNKANFNQLETAHYEKVTRCALFISLSMAGTFCTLDIAIRKFEATEKV